MDKITELTAEQEQQLVAFRNRWLAIGLATGSVNLEAITPVIHDFYARIDKPAPYIWRCQSPLQAQLVMNLGANLGDNLRANLRANLWDNLGDNLRANLRVNLGVNLGDNLGVNLWDNLGDNLWDNLGANLGDNRKYYSTSFWGSLDSYWIAYYLYPHEQLQSMHTPEQMSILNGWATLAQHCFWWYPFENVCFVCDRPTVIYRENDRLHNENGPAVCFSDGYELYCWHGVNVDKRIIMEPETITIDEIDNESNAELRRVKIERRGWGWYLENSQSEKLHNDPFGTLYRKPERDIEGGYVYAIQVTCPSTNRQYTLSVDPSAYDGAAGKIAHAASASLWRNPDGSLLFPDYRQYKPNYES